MHRLKPIARKEVLPMNLVRVLCMHKVPLKVRRGRFGNSLQRCPYMGKTSPLRENFSLAIFSSAPCSLPYWAAEKSGVLNGWENYLWEMEEKVGLYGTQK